MAKIIKFDGQQHSFPDDFTDDDIAAALGSSEQPQVSLAGDIAGSARTGLTEGAIGIAGAGGDMRNLASSATDWLGGKVGLSPETIGGIKSAAAAAARFNPITAAVALGPTSETVGNAVKKRTGELYQPQTTIGEGVRTIGNFVPGVIGGPGGLLRRLMFQAVIPGAASEIAGQYTKGTKAEPYARAATALGAAVLGAKRTPAQPVLADDLKSAATQVYENPVVKGLVIEPAGLARLSRQIEKGMESGGARRDYSGAAFSRADELAALPNTSTGQAMRKAGLNPGATVDDIVSVRTALRGVASDNIANPITGEFNTTGKAAIGARATLNKYLSNIPAEDIRSGDAALAGKYLRQADADYAASKRARLVEKIMRNAGIDAAAANSGQNINNAMRQKLKTLLKNEAILAGLNKAEIAQLERAVLGTRTGNVARFLGNALAPSGAMLFQNSAAAGALGGLAAMGAGADPTTSAVVTALLSQGVGRGARRIGNFSQARQTRKFQDAVVSRAPSYAAIKAVKSGNASLLNAEQRRIALVRALLGTQAMPRLNTNQQ